jgi:hypothetical protein
VVRCGRAACRLFEEVLIDLDQVHGALDLDADAVADHQPGQTLHVDQHNPGGLLLGERHAAALRLLVVMKSPWLAWLPASAPAKACSAGRPRTLSGAYRLAWT